MGCEPIVKSARDWKLAPQLGDYSQACASFTWKQARHGLAGLSAGQGLNMAHEAVDRHAAGPGGNRVAIRWLSKSGGARDITFRDLRGLTNRFANVLQSLGVEFVPSLPRTRSGKIMRRLLKARELGLPEGDTSTLEAG